MRWYLTRLFSTLALLVAGVSGGSAESFTPPAGKRWVTVASMQELDAAIGIARLFRGEARVVSAKGGWYAVTLEPRSGTIAQIRQAMPWPELPADALLSNGANYLATVWRHAEPAHKVATVQPGKQATLRMNGLQVTLARESKPDGWVAHLSGKDASGAVFDLRHSFDGVSDFESELRLIELDTTNTTPEIVFDAFTGGAHCCVVTVVLTQASPGQWRFVELGQLDGGGPSFEDVDGDGHAEIIRPDNQFLYAFSSYADSVQPILIGQLNGSRIDDATMTPAFRRRLVQDTRQIEFLATVDPTRWNANGFLAAWVAASFRIGEGEQAFRRASNDYDRNSDFGMPECSLPMPISSCPADNLRQLAFPEGLRRFLNDTGYASASSAPLPSGSAPSGEVSLKDARAAFMALPLERRQDIQVLLAATGHWPAVASDGFGPKLYDAIRIFQSSAGRTPTGVVTGDDYDILLRLASPILKTWSLERVRHPLAPAAMWVPQGLAPVRQTIDGNLAFSSEATGVTVLFLYAAGGSIPAGYEVMLGKVKAHTVDYSVVKPAFFAISSHTDVLSQYTRFQMVEGGIVGFVLMWPAKSDFYGDRLSTVMSDFFRAENELGVRRVPPQPVINVALPPSANTIAPAANSPARTAERRNATGSGFFVAPDKLLTNAHVVEGCTTVEVAFENRTSTGTVIGRDAMNDLAVVETTVRSNEFARLRSGIRLGEDVAAFGYPLSGLLASSGNFTKGTVTATAGIGDDARHLQISAPVQPGNSGGPLLDESGNVIGVVVSKIDAVAVAVLTDDIPQNVNFAIKAAIAGAFLESKSIAYAAGNTADPLKSADLAEKAQSFTAALRCSAP